MTERSTKTFIGAFVLGAIALLIGLIIILGSGQFGKKNPTFVLYFTTSLKGLTQGSPVYFKGIRIGKVISIQILPDMSNTEFHTPVIIEIEQDKAMALLEDGREKDLFNEPDILERLIKAGLRGKLGLSSILTGQLCVELDIMHSASPVDISKLQPYKDAPQIPTQLSSLDAALSTLENMPVQEILLNVMGSMKNMSEQLSRIDVSGLLASLHKTSDAIRSEVSAFSSLRESAGGTLSAYTSLAGSLQKDIHSTLSSVSSTLKSMESLVSQSEGMVMEARNAMKDVRHTARTANDLFSEDSASVVEFSQTMLSLRKAAQALSDLATLLEITPNALIFGRTH